MALNKNNSQWVAIFNPYKNFVGVCRSITQTAAMLGVSAPNVYMACNGDSMSCKGLYVRSWSKDIISLSELEKLSLVEYDKLCNEKRKYYATPTMSRKGMKYKTRYVSGCDEKGNLLTCHK